MRFAWKVTMVTLTVIVLSFSVGSYLLVSLSFHSALDRETAVAQEELEMLCIAYAATCEAQGVTLENISPTHSAGARLQRILEDNPYFADRQFRVSTEEGAQVYSTLSAPGDPELLESVGRTATGYVIRRDASSGCTRVHCAAPIFLEGGVVYMETVRDITELFVDRETHYRVYRYLLLLVAALGGGLLFLLSTWLTRPIRSLEKVTARLAAGDYSSRAEISGDDEVSQLAENFNRMADAIASNVQALEDAARRQEDFTSSFVHELKTPLTSIIGYADMLRGGNLPEEKRFKAASYIFSEGKRLENLSLALMSLKVAGHSAVDVGPVQMARLVEDTAKAIRPAMTAKGLTLVSQAEEGVLLGDAPLLQTLMMNLLDNARKASSAGSRVELRGEALPEGYRLVVRDYGRGIPAGELDKITEAFYMVDKSRSRAEGGAGLGLALCKEIAAFHGGTMCFASREGQGTTVTVVLGGARSEEK